MNIFTGLPSSWSNYDKIEGVEGSEKMQDNKELLNKLEKLIENIPLECRINCQSKLNKLEKSEHLKKFHPIRPSKGDIFNAFLGENSGSELCGNHLVIILQNKKGNIYGEKVNVLPIEGDGTKINPNYQIKLTNDDLEFGKLDKNPSRVIITDITTIDKARLDRVKIGKIKNGKMLDISNMLIKQLELIDIKESK